MKKIKKNKCIHISIISSLLLLGTGLFLTLKGTFIMMYIIDNQMMLTPTSQTFEEWKKEAGPFHVNYYFFNWTNPEEIHSNNVKPKLVQTGPYRFNTKRQTVDIVFNENGTITCRYKNFWFIKDDEAGEKLKKDKITIINPVTSSAVYITRNEGFFARRGLSLFLSGMAPEIHVSKPVNELLFDGYQDDIVTLAKPFVSESFPLKDKFGLLYKINGSADVEGIFNIGTGAGTNSTLGRIYQWNYYKQSPYYNGECGKIHGSGGDFFEHDLKSNFINFFATGVCRTISLYFEGFSRIHGITGRKYAMTAETFDNGNKCSCSGECGPPGVFNVSACRYGAPSFISLPHFYNADPYYQHQVEGLEPNRSQHEFFITIEPTTGVPLEVIARFQINILIDKVPGISLYSNVPKIVFPIFWFEQKYEMPEDKALSLWLLVNIPQGCLIMGLVMMAISLILIIYTLHHLWKSKKCSRSKEEIDDENCIPLKCSH